MIRPSTLIFSFIISFQILIEPLYSTLNSEKYTLNRCIELGLLNNVNIIYAENSVISAESQRKQTLGNFVPSLDASAQWSRTDRDQLRLRNDQLIRSRDNFGASVSSNLTLFDGLSNIATAEQAVITQRSTQYDLARTKQDIIYQIQAGYFNVLRTKRLLAVAQENIRRSQKQLERIQELNRVGSLPLADVYRQQVQVGRDELSLIQAQNDVNNALADLSFLIGVKSTEDFDVDESTSDATIDSVTIRDFREQVKNYERTVREAVASRPDYQSALEQKNSAEKGLIIARAGYFPSLSASASYGWSDFIFKDFLTVNNIKENDRFSYGLSLSIPILSNFRTSNAVEQALITKRNSEENLKQLERQIGVQLRKALNQLETAEKNIEITKKNLIASGEDLRIAEERYAIGAGTLLDQIIANSNYISAQSDNVNSVYNYLTARKQVEYYIGTSK